MSVTPQGRPLFSVIVPTYRRPRQLAACLEALARLDYPRDRFEVLVVNDGSDALPEAATSAAGGRLAVRVLTQPHAGPGAARNTGAAHAKGEFLAFTDDDCAPESGWLRILATHLVRAPDSAVGGRTLNALPRNPYSATSQLILEYLYSYYNPVAERARFLGSANLALGAAGFRAVGGFNASFSRAAEDREFCNRWLGAGRRLIYASEALVYHAHDLTFSTFCRQHFNYGRGAFSYYRERARHSDAGFRAEPFSFYANLARLAVSRRPGRLQQAMALMAAQVAGVTGFAWETGCRILKKAEWSPGSRTPTISDG